MLFNKEIVFPSEISVYPLMRPMGNTGLVYHAGNEVDAIEIPCEIPAKDTFAGTKTYRRFLCSNGQSFIWVHGEGDERVKDYNKIKLSDVLSSTEIEAYFDAHAEREEKEAEEKAAREACKYFDERNHLPTPNGWYKHNAG